MKLLLLYLLLFSLGLSAQVPGYVYQQGDKQLPPMLQQKWQLQTMTRNMGIIVFYDATKDKAFGYPPVYWQLSTDTIVIPHLDNTHDTVVQQMRIIGDLSVPANDPMANDVVESHRYRISGDTLILNRYYTKGLELATVTNADQAYYKIERLTEDKLVLVLYDRYPDKTFRPIDKYSRRYSFSR